MIILLYIAILLLTGVVSGMVGSLSGLGGGLIVIPILTLLLGVPIQYAAGVSLVSVIATSSGSASTYVKDRLVNLRIGMSLEIATTLGAIGGALVAAFLYLNGLQQAVFVIFGLALLLSIYPTRRVFRGRHYIYTRKDPTTEKFQLSGSYYDREERKRVQYSGSRWWRGEAVMGIAGVISGLLGVGSGVLKVVGLESGMRLPVKVATSTSNFMMGVTAAVGSAVYWSFGYIQPFLLAPIVIGILIGSYFGARILERATNVKLRELFLFLLIIVGIEMILRGLGIA